MCGNFGLLMLLGCTRADCAECDANLREAQKQQGVDSSSSRSGGGGCSSAGAIRPAMEILDAMASATEIRGGQAAGIASCFWDGTDPGSNKAGKARKTEHVRVRALARKRYPIASIVIKAYLDKARELKRRLTLDGLGITANASPRAGRKQDAVTFIGHTRFATSSKNTVRELHPHEWVPFHEEDVWLLRGGKFSKIPRVTVGINITHNGDFEAMEAFGIEATNGEVGLWLRKVLHRDNEAHGDSAKIAGMMDFLRTQGRWAASVRLAYQRGVANSLEDASGKGPLKGEINTAPTERWCEEVGAYMDARFGEHVGNIIKVASSGESYKIDRPSTAQFVKVVGDTLIKISKTHTPSTTASDVDGSGEGNAAGSSGATEGSLSKTEASSSKMSELLSSLSEQDVRSIVRHSTRAFLRADIFAAMSELLARGHGSFGTTVFSTLEPGTVVLGCMGQPLVIAVDDDIPAALYGSEASAVAVPACNPTKGTATADVSGSSSRPVSFRSSRSNSQGAAAGTVGRSLNRVLNLSGAGEVVRCGLPSPLDDGDDFSGGRTPDERVNVGLLLPCGIQLRSYSLETNCEAPTALLDKRLERQGMSAAESKGGFSASASKKSVVPEVPPGVDLVEHDLRWTPAVLAKIENDWNGRNGARPQPVPEGMPSAGQAYDNLAAASAFAEKIHARMRLQHMQRRHTIDVLVGGIEASLWMGEQFAAGLRLLFPRLNIRAYSTNKLLAFSGLTPRQVYFCGSDEVTADDLDPSTVVLLISQSGQTFPTLHATRILAESKAGGNVFILTGTVNSKMEQSLAQNGPPQTGPRVFNNHSGLRPAEPSSLAIAATHHTLTHLTLNVAKHVHMRAQELSERRLPPTPRGTAPTRGNSGSIMAAERKGAEDMLRGEIRDVFDAASMVTTATVSGISKVVGYNDRGWAAPSAVNVRLKNQGIRWAAHVKETWECLVMVGAYIIFSVTLQLPVVNTIAWVISSIARGIGAPGCLHMCWNSFVWLPSSWEDGPGYPLLGLLLRLLDALVYIWIGYALVLFKRWRGGRPLWARLGKRTVVIVDTPCVHQLAESFLSKLFSMSYSFNGLEVHGGSGCDHFVHRYTHRVSRGVLIAAGRPDGRLRSLTVTESSVLLACKQAAFIDNWGMGPEIVSVGHNPYSGEWTDNHITLPTCRNKFVDEEIHTQTNSTTNQRSVESVISDISCRGYREWERKSSMGGGDPATSSSGSSQVMPRSASMKRRGIMARYNSNLNKLTAAGPTTDSARVGRELSSSNESMHLESGSNVPYGAHHASKRMSGQRMSSGTANDPLVTQANVPYGAHHASKRLSGGKPSAMPLSSNSNGSSSARVLPEGSAESVVSLPAGVEEAGGGLYDEFFQDLSVPVESVGLGIQRSIQSIGQSSRRGSLENSFTTLAAAATAAIERAKEERGGSLLPRDFSASGGAGMDASRDSAASLSKSRHDPANLLSFASKLDANILAVQDKLQSVQLFYECRVATLDRYMAFCVMFHAMAKDCSAPMLRRAWDVARSQSNLRVATTASPIHVSEEEGNKIHGAKARWSARAAASRLIGGVSIRF